MTDTDLKNKISRLILANTWATIDEKVGGTFDAADAIISLFAKADHPSGVANLKAILSDQTYLNSALSVFEIRAILDNAGGFMPDEAVAWFRGARGTFGTSDLVSRSGNSND